MEPWLISFFSGLGGAIIGGIVSAWGAVKAVRAIQADLEADEIRRHKISCLVNLMGLLIALTGGQTIATPDDKSRITFELNRAVALWSGDTTVSNLLRDVWSNSSTENIAKLLRAMSKDTKLSFDHLSEADLQQVFQVR